MLGFLGMYPMNMWTISFLSTPIIEKRKLSISASVFALTTSLFAMLFSILLAILYENLYKLIGQR